MKVNIHNVMLEASNSTLAEYRSWLSADEKIRADRYRLSRLSRRFTAAHGILRRILSEYLEIPPGSINLKSTANGKPYIDLAQNTDNIQYSLSHSEDVAVIAVCHDRNIGVDIEKYDVTRPVMELAFRYFSREENNHLSCLHDICRIRAFYRMWTLKESWLKATGMGIAGLANIETSPLNQNDYEIIRWKLGDCVMSADGCPMDYEHFEPIPGFTACYTRLYSSHTVSTI